MHTTIVGHRANTIRRMKFYKKYNVDYIELDLTQKDKDIIVYHGEDLVSSVSKKEWIIKQVLSKLQGRDRLLFKPLTAQQALIKARKILGYNTGIWLDIKDVENIKYIYNILKEIKIYYNNIINVKPIILSSNSIRLLNEIKEKIIKQSNYEILLAINILYKDIEYDFIKNLAVKVGAKIVSFNTETFEYDLALLLKKQSFKIALWTVNSPSYLSKLGEREKLRLVDYLITDRPDLVGFN